jgi:MFS family permease
MRDILQKRALRFVLAANVVSMFGSGMNSAAMAWYILETTRSEVALGTLAVLAAVPAMVLMIFGGVIIDREDRRRLVMLLDAARAVVILAVAVLAFTHHVRIWQLYLMHMLVSAGFWMFWPSITALIQELTPDSEFVNANTFLMVGVQGGWLIAGSIVGFVYGHIGLGGVLLVDVTTYVVSFACYFAVRKGRHVVPRPAELRTDLHAAETAVGRFWRELREGLAFLRVRPNLILLGGAWAVFLGAMLTGMVVTAPLSEKTFHAGATGYGWLNAGWGTGAFLCGLFATQLLARVSPRSATAGAMLVLAFGMFASPFSPWLAGAVLLYGMMGAARGVCGVAMNTSLMQAVPPHFMGRVQNAYNFGGTVLQILLSLAAAHVAHAFSLVYGFAVIGAAYVFAFLFAAWPVAKVENAELAVSG